MARLETAARFPVVMLYDHFESVGKAMATYSHLKRELKDDYEPDLSVWCIEDATSAEYSARANRDIAAAEVIIMTVRGDEPFPAALQHWKGEADRGGVEPPHAIIALIGSVDGPEPAAGTWNSVLRSAATQIHPEVFVYEPPLESNAWRHDQSVTAECHDIQPPDTNGPN